MQVVKVAGNVPKDVINTGTCQAKRIMLINGLLRDDTNVYGRDMKGTLLKINADDFEQLVNPVDLQDNHKLKFKLQAFYQNNLKPPLDASVNGFIKKRLKRQKN